MKPVKLIILGSNDKFISVSEDHWFTNNQMYHAIKIEYGTEVLVDKDALKEMLKSTKIFDDFAVTIKKVNNQYSVYFDKIKDYKCPHGYDNSDDCLVCCH